MDFSKMNSLTLAAQKGNMEAFNEIYTLTAQSQYYHIRQVLKDPYEAQDALQETYILLYQNLHKINPPSALNAYLNRLAFYVSKNFAKMLMRRQHRYPAIEQEDAVMGLDDERLNALEDMERAETIRGEIEKLPERQKKIIVMKYYQDMSSNDIAAVLSLSVPSVNRLCRIARDTLRESLKKQGVFSAVGFSKIVADAIGSGLKNVSLPPAPDISNAAPTICSDDLPSVPKIPKSSFIASKMGTGFLLKSIAILAGLSGTAFLGMSNAHRLSIEQVRVPTKICASPAAVTFQVDSGRSIMNVRCVADDGSSSETAKARKSAAVIPTGDDTYKAEIPSNGNYRLIVRAEGGRTVSYRLRVSCIDTTPPKVELKSMAPHKLTIHLTDKGTGIDSSSLICKSESGILTRASSFNKNTGIAVFDLPAENQTLYFADKAGNQMEAPLIFKNK